MATSSRRGPLRVVVASDQALIAEAVRAALAGLGHDARVVRWPGDGLPQPRTPSRPPAVDAGLLLCDLDRWSRLRAAAVVLGRIPVPWLALTTAPRGPAWGAALAAGARVVLPGNTSLEQAVQVLRELVQGRGAMPAEERAQLEESWRRLQARREEVVARLAQLTPRELDVLRLLDAGEPVIRIAARLGIAPATVRSQVKAVLRKLEVNSQLAAVAAFRDASDVLAAPVPPSSPPSSPGPPRSPASY